MAQFIAGFMVGSFVTGYIANYVCNNAIERHREDKEWVIQKNIRDNRSIWCHECKKTYFLPFDPRTKYGITEFTFKCEESSEDVNQKFKHSVVEKANNKTHLLD